MTDTKTMARDALDDRAATALIAVRKLIDTMSKEITPKERLDDLDATNFYIDDQEDVRRGMAAGAAFAINAGYEIRAFYEFVPYLKLIEAALTVMTSRTPTTGEKVDVHRLGELIRDRAMDFSYPVKLEQDQGLYIAKAITSKYDLVRKVGE